MKLKEAYKNFLDHNENFDVFNRLPFLTTSLDGESYVVLATEKRFVVGVYAFENYDKNNIKTLYIQVDKNYRNKGVATQLIKNLFTWAKQNNKGIIISQFSEDGKKYIKHKLLELSEEYKINFYLTEEEFEWFN
jgi:GNAT superfamily N-acetyltransferase